MDLQVLMSTMNRDDLIFLEEVNLSCPALVVNQNTTREGVVDTEYQQLPVKLINSLDRGLSRSRNLAIAHSQADICLLADDDISYHPGYDETILHAYQDYPQADVIAFQVARVNAPDRAKQFRTRKSWEGYLTSMKISSVEISFRRESIIDSGITFNTDFGAGASFSHGEENIFLYDCLDKGLKILYLPIEIGQVDASQSTWFQGYNDHYFHTLGAKFYNMSQVSYPLLILQFALRKYGQYKGVYSLKQAMSLMFSGAREYKKRRESNGGN